MSQPPSPFEPGNPAGDHQTALTPDTIETILNDFRSWLQQAAVLPPPPDDGGEQIDLHTLLGQFLALKHEVNLQTRAVRAQQEQNAETLRQLSQSLDLLRQSQARATTSDTASEEEQMRPVLKALVDVADALGLARREVGRVQEVLASHLEQLAVTDSGRLVAEPRSLWSRMFSSGSHFEEDWGRHTERQQEARRAAEQVRRFLESVITGYIMSLERVERALQQQGLEPIPAVGEAFDPEQMEVVEAVTGSGRPPGEVVQEVRRGYLWRGRVFRYAQVSVAKGG